MTLLVRAQTWLQVASTPTLAGLPSTRAIAAFPLVLLLGLVLLTALGITGSSTGFIQPYLSTAPDPDAILGGPLGIRSDEWFVQTSWTISQVEQGLPIINHSFPGGMDATVQHELPSSDWSMIFRPHLLGFLGLPIDNAMAIKWWLPGFALMAACYFFVITVAPKRPVMAAALSVAFFFAPFFQLWYLPITLWPVAWAFLAMATCVWLLRAPGRTPRIVLTLLVGYVTVTMGMGIYVPFIIPAVLVVLAFCVGAVFTRHEDDRYQAIRSRLAAVLPMLIAGLAAVAVLGIWILTRLPSIERFLGTVYPGQRLGATGDLSLQGAVALMAGPLSAGLAGTSGAPLGANASEASTFLYVGLFLVIGLVWIIVRDARRRSMDWMIVCAVAIGALIVAFLAVPGWDSIAHVLFLDRTTGARIVLGLGILSVVFIALLARRQDLEQPQRPVLPWWVTWLTIGVAAIVNIAMLAFVWFEGRSLLLTDFRWIAVGILFMLALLLFTRGRMTVAAAALLLASLLTSAGINPLYRGVFDTNTTQIGEAIERIDDEDPGAWVGIGDTFLPTVILVQSGQSTFNGFQSAPPETMWRWIDPERDYEYAWNRLANITWHEGAGDPVLTNPTADQIYATFDSCANFAQEHVKYVLAEEPLDRQGCLELQEQIDEGPSRFWIYQVVDEG